MKNWQFFQDFFRENLAKYLSYNFKTWYLAFRGLLITSMDVSRYVSYDLLNLYDRYLKNMKNAFVWDGAKLPGNREPIKNCDEKSMEVAVF